MSVLTDEQKSHFTEQGYVVVPSGIPPERLQAVVAAIFEFLQMNPDDPADWYRAPLSWGGMLEMYQHPAMWDTRQWPRVHEIFSDLLGTSNLWVSLDRVNFKPPLNPDYPKYDWKGMSHWDMDISTAPVAPCGVQGVLYLTDTDANQGGFTCAPGHHKTAVEWAKTAAPGTRPDMTGIEMVPIVGRAGDLVIWDRRLYHGNGRNTSDRPRLAQFISMYPAPTGDRFASEAARRVSEWQNRLPPPYEWVGNDPRHFEQTHGTTATLTDLGRKLLGAEAW